MTDDHVEYQSGGQEAREEQLRHHVAQLKEELERERAEKRQIHHEKVREMKASREKEQSYALEQLETLKAKLHEEKMQELQEQREQLVKDYQSKLTTTEKQYKDHMTNMKHTHNREKEELRETLTAELKEELEEALGSKYESNKQKLLQEMFEMQQELSTAKAKNADLADADKNTATVLRDIDKKHRNELETLNKQHRLALKKQMEELEATNRKMTGKDKELAKLTERLSRMEADRDRLQDEVKRLKQAESWTRRSATPPSLSPSSSMNDLVSKRERDMVMKNSELSFRVRTLEDTVSKLKQEKTKLQTKLSESRQQLAPLQQHNIKLSHRINDLNSTLRSREKKVEQLSKNLLELKSEKQQLEEENTRQRKSLQQQMSRTSACHEEKEKLKSKNLKLSQTNDSLTDQLKILKSEKRDLEEHFMNSSPLHPSHPPFSTISPRPLSPTSSLGDDSPLSSSTESSVLQEQLDQLQFDKEESEVKYEEMKAEYVNLRENYKKQQSKFEKLQEKYKGLQAKHKLLQKEHTDLEQEVVLLHKFGEIGPAHDVKRFETTLEPLHRQLEEKEMRICELEDFIVEQDEVARKSEEELQREKNKLQTQLVELSSRMEDGHDQLSKRVSELESELDQTSRILKLKEVEIAQLQQRMSAASEPKSYTEEDGYGVPGSPLSPRQLEQSVLQYKTDMTHLENKNANLQRDLDKAVEQVGQLQVLMMKLEERLEKNGRAHQEAVASRDDEIDALNQQLTQLEANTVKLRRALPVEVDQEEAKVLAEQVCEAMTRVKAAAALDSNTVKAEVVPLEDAVMKLLHLLLPDYTPSISDTPAVVSSSPRLQKRRESDQLLEVTSAAPQSSSPVQVSSDFTDLPLNCHKVTASEQLPLLSSTAPPQNILPLNTDTNIPLNLKSVDSSSQSSLGDLESPTGSLPALLLDNDSSLERSLTFDKSSQTTQPAATEDRSSQTPTISRPTTRDSLTQTPMTMTDENWTQTPHTRRPAMADGVSQTRSTRTISCSSQTPHSTKTRAADKSSQTPGAWKPAMDATVVPKPTDHTLPHTPSHSVDGGESPCRYHMLPNGRYLPTPAPLATASVSGENKPNGIVDKLPRIFVAVMDYDPNSLCTTGRPEMELHFHIGDVLCVEGDMDENGYYCASFGGVSGLVPANFVQEAEVSDFSIRERLFNQTLTHNSSTSSCLSPLTNTSQQQPLLTHSQIPKEGSCCPQFPLSFHVERAVGHNGLLVAWQPPPMDGMCRSNGCLVTGYQLYVNGETTGLVSGALQTRTILQGVSLSKPLKLGISTSSVEGKSSKVMEIVYCGRPLNISSTSPEPEVYKTYIALYDYNPMKCSPSENPEFELSFKSGDIIKVHGKEKDGFLVGELNGKQGWVPAIFVSLVSGPTDKAVSPTLSASLRGSPGHVTSSAHRRMLAIYDYDPMKMSPNPNPDAELAFKTGNIITIYGNMSDGFYSGEVDGRFGLVPSNFLQELKQQRRGPQVN